jgi:hypothetical protein
MNNWLTFLEGRKIVIATKHQKESILGPMLEKELHVNFAVTTGLDTDQLGTFSGEIERIKGAYQSLLAFTFQNIKQQTDFDPAHAKNYWENLVK